MMRFRVFSTLLLVLLSCAAFAQFRLSGTMVSDKGTAVAGCTVLLGKDKSAVSDSLGRFVFEDLPARTFQLYTHCPEFKSYRQEVLVHANTEIQIILLPRHASINEVIVRDKADEFGRTRMRGIENMGIYEGKKSEVIVMDQLVANLSTNNARQIYARVPGLNIWENDGSGLQLNIGGRGLDPNRTSNFNVRQNGYDISADALGYPESYYTPMTEAVSRIQVVRGAASLQYGTQFGGLLNFVMKQPVEEKKLEVIARQSFGSFGFYNAFTSASGTIGKFSYYTAFQYKTGNGWRPNSDFDTYNGYANFNYKFNEKTKIGVDYTVMSYLAHQPGGLDAIMFKKDPRQSNRERNWFKVNWNLWALHFTHNFNESNEFNVRVFGLNANRYSLGFRPNRVNTVDNDDFGRDLIKGQFNNVGVETRFLHRFEVFKKSSALLVGARYYNGFSHSQQGLGETGRAANFTFVNPDQFITSDYNFPNQNLALFAENVLYVNEKFSVTPGLRAEFINTRAKGYYSVVNKDIAGNLDPIYRTYESRKSPRNFILGGIGLSFKPSEKVDLYGNISQNYKSITFSDQQIVNPSFLIDPDLKDESGYSFDLGIRSNRTSFLNYDLGIFYLDYNNRIGENLVKDTVNLRSIRYRTNVGHAVVKGIESYAEIDLVKALNPAQEKWSVVPFVNCAIIKSRYVSSSINGIKGNEVEFVPAYNLKTGLRVAYNKLKASFLFTTVGSQFSDATNALEGGASSVVGQIPAYNVMDLSLSYEWRRYKLETTLNNIANQMYYTRIATGYPGPGILPSDGRAIYVTAQVKF